MNKFDFRQLSKKFRCPECGRFLKLNVIVRGIKLPRLCYKCWLAKQSKRDGKSGTFLIKAAKELK